MRKRNCRTLSLSIFLVRRRNFKPKNIPCVEAELQNFKSHNSLCAEAELQVYVESIWFLMQESGVPGSAGPKTPVSKPSWRCCSQLCHLGGGPYWDCFSNSVFIKHDRISWRVTRIRTLGKHHDRKPQGQSFLKGQYVERDEGDFWALQKGSRKGFSPVLPRALAGAYWPYLAHGESHVL